MITDTAVLVLFAVMMSLTPEVQSRIPGQDTEIKGVLEYEKLLEKECDRNGGPEAYFYLKRNSESLDKCIQSAIGTLRHVDRMEADAPMQSPGKMDFMNFCPRISNFKDCVPYFTEPMRICTEPKYRDVVNTTHNTINSMLDFVCADEGLPIKEFLTHGGLECFFSKEEAYLGCTRQIFNDYVSNGPARETRRLPPPLGIEECTVLEKFQHCIFEAFRECKELTPANVVDSMFNFVKQNTSCDELLKSQSSVTDVNVLLITALTAITMFGRFA